MARREDEHVHNVLEEVPPHAERKPVEVCLLRCLVVDFGPEDLAQFLDVARAGDLSV